MTLIIKKLEEIKNKLNHDLFSNSQEEYKGLAQRLGGIVKKRFGNDDEYNKTIKKWISKIYFYSSDKIELSSFIDVLIDDLELQENKKELVINPNLDLDLDNKALKIVQSINKKVFIVHGHNNEIKQATARIVGKLGLEPIILHEQPNMGMTIIEKFLSNSNVGFAIVILSGDDIILDGDVTTYRARQNVVLELGFFYAKLGRNKVVALVESKKSIELPSDIHGIIYIPYDSDNGNWKFEIAKELSNNGYNINVNNIL